jgi:hypothetical protein
MVRLWPVGEPVENGDRSLDPPSYLHSTERVSGLERRAGIEPLCSTEVGKVAEKLDKATGI